MSLFPEHLFKSYDIRGLVDIDLTDHLVALVGAGVAHVMYAQKIVIGEDVRESSTRFADVLSEAIQSQGVDVVRIGLCGTEEVYHATADKGADAGIMVTASHNPVEYNGLKIVRKDAKPFTAEEDMPKLKAFVKEYFDATLTPALQTGEEVWQEDKTSYVHKILSFVDIKKLKPLKIVVNAGNGCAGPAFDEIAKHLPFEFVRINHRPDGTFPNGIPNPMLVENRAATSEAVQKHKADFGVAWDGDFDRCFLFDNKGQFISNYYLSGLLAKQMLATEKGGTIVQDVRQKWDTSAIIEEMGGQGVFSKVGHGHYKKLMRMHNAIMGGEISGHFYFRDFHYCDSGMIPWLLVAELLSQSQEKLSDIIGERQSLYPSSEEINQTLTEDTQAILQKLEDVFGALGGQVDKRDGVSVEFEDWRFNVRPSSNEPLLRINLEAKTPDLVSIKLDEIQKLVE